MPWPSGYDCIISACLFNEIISDIRITYDISRTVGRVFSPTLLGRFNTLFVIRHGVKVSQAPVARIAVEFEKKRRAEDPTYSPWI